MATRASGRGVEQRLPARGGGRIEASGRRRGGVQAQLVGAQHRKDRRHPIGCLVDVDPEHRIGERAVAVHLGDRHIVVPVGDRAFGGVRLERDVVQAEGRRDHDRIVDAIAVEFRIVLPWAPGIEHGLDGGREGGRERDDRPDVEIAVRPTVKPPANPERHAVVDRRVTQCAGNPQALDVPVRRDVGFHADHGVSAQQLHRGSGAREIGARQESGRQPIRVHFESHGQRGGRRDGRLNHRVQVERVGPEGFVAERPVPKDVLTLRGNIERRSREQALERCGSARRRSWAAMVGASRRNGDQ